MKLSDAIELGLMIPPELKAANMNYCALGKAADAIGLEQDKSVWNGNRWNNLRKRWPWLKVRGGWLFSFQLKIAFLFDRQFSKGDSSLAILKTIDYVKSIEPECGECNQFTCVCQPAETVEENVYAEA